MARTVKVEHNGRAGSGKNRQRLPSSVLFQQPSAGRPHTVDCAGLGDASGPRHETRIVKLPAKNTSECTQS